MYSFFVLGLFVALAGRGVYLTKSYEIAEI